MMHEKQVSFGLCCFFEVPSLPSVKLIELRSGGAGAGAGGTGIGVSACKNLGATSFIDLAERTAEARSAARDTLNMYNACSLLILNMIIKWILNLII
jgi:hypothetical protein